MRGWAPIAPMLFYTSASNSTYQTTQVIGTGSSSTEEKGARSVDGDFEAHRSRLISALRRMKETAPTWSGRAANVSAGSALTAEQFLFSLPSSVALPKVAPDGEGDVMFVWDAPGRECVVTVEPKLLHLVSKPGDPRGVQINSQRFLGIQIPPSIMRHLPHK